MGGSLFGKSQTLVSNAILMSLRVLDLSFNLLRAVPVELLKIPALQTIYFVQNKITRIEHLGHLGANLRSLELGSNRIRVRMKRAC
jgi:protein phosphatase 1 regulatory subunit 7